jgi:hypothetical protein
MAGRRNVRRAWTDVDVEELKSLAGKLSTAQIAVELDRTIGGIIQKAFDLRLSLRVRDQAEPPQKEARRPFLAG